MPTEKQLKCKFKSGDICRGHKVGLGIDAEVLIGKYPLILYKQVKYFFL